jgi:hypothetical protein
MLVQGPATQKVAAEMSSCSVGSRHVLAVATPARQQQQQQQWQQLLEQQGCYQQQQQQLYGGASAAELQGGGGMLLGEPSAAASLGGCSMVSQGNRWAEVRAEMSHCMQQQLVCFFMLL